MYLLGRLLYISLPQSLSHSQYCSILPNFVSQSTNCMLLPSGPVDVQRTSIERPYWAWGRPKKTSSGRTK